MLQWSHSVNFTVKFVLAEIKTFFFWGPEAVDLHVSCTCMGQNLPVQKEWISYINLCFLAELIIAIIFWTQLVCWMCIQSADKNALWSAFKYASHATINMLLSIKINNTLWSKDEKDMLIERALQIYHEKRRILSLEEREPATKKARTMVAVEEEVYILYNRQWVGRLTLYAL